VARASTFPSTWNSTGRWSRSSASAPRDTEIRARHAEGEKADALAREYGLTDRAIWYIVGRVDALDDSQLPLI
jgi:Mor family transcriptional regulator